MNIYKRIKRLSLHIKDNADTRGVPHIGAAVCAVLGLPDTSNWEESDYDAMESVLEDSIRALEVRWGIVARRDEICKVPVNAAIGREENNDVQ